MKSSVRRTSLLAALAIATVSALFVFLGVRNVYAHEGRDVGLCDGLQLEVEPAFVGVPNRTEVFIAMKDNEDNKVEDAEKTLKLSVKFGNQTRNVPLDAAWQEPAIMSLTSPQLALATMCST